MIDGHVHAFPTLGESVASAVGDAFGARASDVVARRVAPRVKSAASRLLARAKPLLDRAPSLDIEAVDRVRARAGRLHRAVEAAGSVALMPVMLGGSVEGLLASMDRHGIARSVLIGSRGVSSNAWLLGEAARKGGDRLIPVATIPELPTSTPAAEWLAAYEALADAGARGFKIHSNWDDAGADHPAVEAIFEVARARNLFVILHTGCFHVVGYKREGAVPCDSFARFFDAFPTVKVCLAHMHRDEPERAWELMKRYPQLYADTSWQTAENIRRAIATVGSDRIMLGSDFPLLHLELQGDAIARVREAAKDATSATLDDLFEGSARRFVGEGQSAAKANERAS